MEVAKIFVSKNLINVKYLAPITSGTIGATISFEFDEAWDGFDKTYVFRAGGKTKDVTQATGIIPAELLKEHGQRLEAGVCFTKGNNAITTMWADLGDIREGADPSGDESTDPSLPVWAQLQEDIEELKQQGGGGGTGSAVLYTAQTLDESQQAQARENICAATVEEVLAALPAAEGVSY